MWFVKDLIGVQPHHATNLRRSSTFGRFGLKRDLLLRNPCSTGIAKTVLSAFSCATSSSFSKLTYEPVGASSSSAAIRKTSPAREKPRSCSGMWGLGVSGHLQSYILRCPSWFACQAVSACPASKYGNLLILASLACEVKRLGSQGWAIHMPRLSRAAMAALTDGSRPIVWLEGQCQVCPSLGGRG